MSCLRVIREVTRRIDEVASVQCDVCGEDAFWKPTQQPFAVIDATAGPGRGDRRNTLDLCDRCYLRAMEALRTRAFELGRELPETREEFVGS